MVSFVNGGLGVVGTPERAIEQLQTLWEQSNGGFGTYLMLAHNWTNTAATKKSYELFANEVMPHFQSGGGGLVDAAERAKAARPALAEQSLQAVAEATQSYEAERAAKPAS
jgi:limonene 1,2-monooxygenase